VGPEAIFGKALTEGADLAGGKAGSATIPEAVGGEDEVTS